MTVTIDFFNSPFDKEPTLFQAETVAHWILDNKSKLVNFAVFDGQPSLETDITKDVQKLMAADGDYVVLNSPAAPVIAFAVVYWAEIAAVLAVVGTGYALYQLSKIKLPDNINRTQQSS
jgi:hypothetical protein